MNVEIETLRRGLTVIETVCVDDDAIAIGTFQSHNQKVVSNQNGIFMTHIRTCNDPYDAQQWRLCWSQDGGETFSTVYESTDATNPPVLETDERDNIYLVRPDFVDKNAYLYRFLAGNGYVKPLISTIPKGSGGKYCMVLDHERDQLYYFVHNNTFHVVGPDGTVRRSVVLLQKGQDATIAYPQLNLDRDGVLHTAWTTVHNPSPMVPGNRIYRDIHYMQSRDGGETWQTMDGTLLSLPIVSDRTGPTDRITPDGELEVHTWLSSFMPKEGKVHFVYLAQSDASQEAAPEMQHYIRYDLGTARRDRDVCPEFKGDQISLHNPSGFFASRALMSGLPLYCVMADGERIACLASEDNGETWHDYAVSDRAFPPCEEGQRIYADGRRSQYRSSSCEEGQRIYAVGGCREITEDGYILGSFTHRLFDPADPATGKYTPVTGYQSVRSHVYFFRVRACNGVRST